MGIIVLLLPPGLRTPIESSQVPIVLIANTPQQERALLSALKKRNFSHVYSPLTLELSFTNTFELQPISLIDGLKIPTSDPRYSPFFAELGKFFYLQWPEDGALDGPRRVYLMPQEFSAWETLLQEGVREAGLATRLFRQKPSPVVYWSLVIFAGLLGLGGLLMYGGRGLSVLGVAIILLAGGINSGRSLVLLPLLSFLSGSLGGVLEVHLKRVLERGLWFRLRHHDLGAILAGYFRLTRKSFRFRERWAFVVVATFFGVGVLSIGFLDGWFYFIRWFLAISLSGLPFVVYAVAKTLALRRRFHPHFSFDPLVEPKNRQKYLLVFGVLVFLIQLMGLGFWYPYGSELLEKFDGNDYYNHAVVHEFFQTWFPFGVAYEDGKPGFRLPVHKFRTSSEGLVYAPEVIDFSQWAASWEPKAGTPGNLFQRLESFGLVRVVLSPADGVYSPGFQRLSTSWPLIFLGLFSFGPLLLGLPSLRARRKCFSFRDNKGLAA